MKFLAFQPSGQRAAKRRAAYRAGGRYQRGVVAVEAAYVLPVIIAAVMMLMELANIGLTINRSSDALARTLSELRTMDTNHLSAGDMESELRARMARASQGYLGTDNIAVIDVERFSTVDVTEGPQAVTPSTAVQAWRITVDVSKDFITPPPRLLSIGNSAFRYRYERVLGEPPP
ncbi:TadE/TadG family type IV pilus assembly protein [Bordetella sp. N]|uniref:TadE/TadG family type IV pilus assembly protein n=1 Tax=Bordetella sp. N TaxID=1746199 RepID=UPI000A58C656|nr:hypothetical protein [Bordetella sp. N]